MKKLILPIFIVGTISITVLVLATTIIWISVTEKHSSPRFVAKQLQSVELFSRSNADYEADVSLLSSETSISEIARIQDCPALFETYAAKYGGSVIDYLDAKHLNSSIEARRKIAKNFGIIDYDGDLLQNELMLKELIAKEKDLTNADCVAYNKN